MIKSLTELQAVIDVGDKAKIETYHLFREKWVPVSVDALNFGMLVRMMGDDRLRVRK